MTIRIHVTKEILEKTKSCKCLIESCAISEAVREIFPNAYTIITTMKPFPKSLNDFGPSINLPFKATEFIMAFDRADSDEERAAMNPISFDIEVPDAVLVEHIGIDEAYKILSESKTLEKV